jgi:outer membrane protein TolC
MKSRFLLMAVLGLAGAVGADVAEGPLALTAAEAMKLAEQNNVTAKLARAGTQEAKGRALQAAANLLPQVTGSVSQSRVYRFNLAAQGFGSFPGIKPLIGPFDVFDARVQLVQTVFDMSAVQRARSAGQFSSSAQAEERLAGQQVAAAGALAYVEALRAANARRAAQAGVELARRLLAQAQDQRRVGTAAGIDVARAETRAAEEDLRLLEAQAADQDAEVRLKRVLGLGMDRDLVLKDTVEYSEAQFPSLDQARTEAFARREELIVSDAFLRAEEESLSAARWARAPSIVLFGDGGLSGNRTDLNDRATGKLGVGLSLPLWTSGRVTGAVREARGRRDEAASRLEDVRAQVDADVRLALDDLRIAALRAVTAEKVERLAEAELKMARDRFSAGAGDNVEVVAAQEAFARGQDSRVAAEAAYHVARVNLAMAVGGMEEFSLHPEERK